MFNPIVRLMVAAHLHLLSASEGGDDRGQSTAEYALVLAGIGAMITLLIVKDPSWLTGLFKTLFSKVVGGLLK